MNDFKCVFNNTDGHQFLAIVSAVHHQRVGQPLHDGALSLTETFGRVPTSRMRQIFGVLLFNGNIILTNIKNNFKQRYMYTLGTKLSNISGSETNITKEYSEEVSE